MIRTTSPTIGAFLACILLTGPARATDTDPCPKVEVVQQTSGQAVALASTGNGEVAVQTAEAIPLAGGEWQAVKPVGTAGKSLTKFTVTPSGYEVVAVLWHTLSSTSTQGSASTDGFGELRLRLVAQQGAPSSATVVVDIYRTILPSAGIQGFLTLDGNAYSLSQAQVEHERQTYTLNVGEELPAISMSGSASLTGLATLMAQTTVVAAVEPCGTTPPASETDNSNDDEADTEDDDDCGSGSGSGEGGDGGEGEGDGDGEGEDEGEGDCPDDGDDDGEGDDGDEDGDDGDGDGDGECGSEGDSGDALHIDLTNGNIWTVVPVFRTYAAGARELDFELRYDSIRAPESSPVGWGWTHSYNIYLQFVQQGQYSYMVYHEGTGRRNAFLNDGAGGYDPPKGRAFQLMWVGEHHELLRTNGTREIFNPPSGGIARISRIIDRRGRTTSFFYDGSGQLERIVSPHGRVVSIQWASGRIWRITDPDSKVTTLEYWSGGEMKKVIDPLTYAVQYEYDGLHRVTKETLKNGKYYTAEYLTGPDRNTIYDSLGNIVARVAGTAQVALPDSRAESMAAGFLTHIDGRGYPWQIKRDNLGRLVQIITPNGRTWKREYGGPTAGNNRNRVVKITNERGYYKTFSWDADGNLIQRRDEANNLTQFQYHPTFKTKLTQRTEPDGDAWVYTYDPNTGDLATIVDPLNETQHGYPADRFVSFTYETHPPTLDVPQGVGVAELPGRIKKKIKTGRNNHQTVLEYDTRGNLISVTRAFGELDLVTTYDHDAMGRTTWRYVERGDRQIVTRWTYDEMGRLIAEIEDPGPPPANLSLLTQRQYDPHGRLDAVTNPRGIVTKYEYDHRNRLKSVTRAYGTLNLKTQWFHDGNGNVETRIDPEGHSTTYVYNEQNFRTQSTDAEGYVTDYTRDEVGNLRRIDRGLNPGVSQEKYSVEYQYDALNRVTNRIVNPGGLALTTHIDYAVGGGGGCSCGTPGRALPYKLIDPKGKVTYFHYDELDHRTKVVRKVGGDTGEQADDNDALTQFEYDPQGNRTAVVRPEGERFEFEYDAADRREIVRAIHSGGNIETILGYDGADNVSTVTQPNGNTVWLVYDGADRLEYAHDALGDLVTLGYDENGNVTERSTAIADQTWQFDYDDADRLWKVFDPIIETPDAYTQFTYDKNGNRTDVIDNNGIRTHYTYDDIDRLLTMVENYQGTDDTANTTTSYGYNGVRQTSIGDHDGNTTFYRYDTAQRLWKIEYPDNNPPGSGVVEYSHDQAGNITWRKDQRGIGTTYTYDDLHYLTGRTYAGTAPPRAESFTFDRSGRLKVADNGVAQLDFGYDDLGRLDTATLAYVGGPSYTTQFDYVVSAGPEGVERITTYPSGRVSTEAYDARLRLDNIGGGTGVGAEFTHDLADRQTGATLGNGVASVFGFDLADQLTSIQHARDVTALFDIEYGYDAVGNRLFTRNLTPGLEDRSELYEYDQRYRLRRMDRGQISGDPEPVLVDPIADNDLAATQDWTVLDRRGNWNEFAETIGVSPVTTTQTRTPNGVNEYQAIDPDGPGPQSAVALAHDANGNLTLDPTGRNLGDGEGGVPDPSGRVYEYDEENRLTAVRRAFDNALLLSISYDAVGRRVSSEDYLAAGDPCGGPPALTRHIYAALETLEEHLSCDGGTGYALAREFIWGDRFPQPVALITHGGTSGGFGGSSVPPGESAYHYLHDVLGSVVALTNAAGQVVERYTYDPYGKTVIEETSPATGLPTARLEASAYGNPFAWTGQRYDAGVRSYQFLFRGYLPHLGRWLQRDPIGYVDGVSLYEYVRSMAMQLIDALGLDDDPMGEAEKEIIRQEGHRDRAKILIGGYAGATAEVMRGVQNVMVAGVIIIVPGPDDVAISVALGTKIGTRVAGLLADVLKGKKVEKVGKAGKKSANILKADDVAQAEKDFEKLSQGAKVEDKGNGVRVATHEDGTKVIIRKSKDGRTTVEIQAPDGTKTKVRYGEKGDTCDPPDSREGEGSGSDEGGEKPSGGESEGGSGGESGGGK